MYSKLVSMRYRNYTLFIDETVNFSEGITLLKGLNSNGKSNVIMGIHELFTCPSNEAQKSSIRFGTECSILTATFSDGVVIEKEKYRNGKTSYTMWKDGEVIFTTIVDGFYTPVKEVPEVIKHYLNIPSSKDVDLFLQQSRGTLLLVNTTGSQNYNFLSSELNNKDLSLAIKLVNKDRLDVRQVLMDAQSRFEIYSSDLAMTKPAPRELLSKFKEIDEELNTLTESIKELESIISKLKNLAKLSESTAILPKISTNQLVNSSSVLGKLQELMSTKPMATFNKLEWGTLNDANSLLTALFSKDLNKTTLTLVKSDEFDVSQLNEVSKLNQKVKPLEIAQEDYDKIQDVLKQLHAKQDKAEAILKKNNLKVTKCSNCGAFNVFNPETNESLFNHGHN